MKKNCFIVIHRNLEGEDAYAFWNEADAQKSVEEYLKIEETNLKNSGYEFRTLRYGSEEKIERAKVYVPELGGRRKTPSIQ